MPPPLAVRQAVLCCACALGCAARDGTTAHEAEPPELVMIPAAPAAAEPASSAGVSTATSASPTMPAPVIDRWAYVRFDGSGPSDPPGVSYEQHHEIYRFVSEQICNGFDEDHRQTCVRHVLEVPPDRTKYDATDLRFLSHLDPIGGHLTPCSSRHPGLARYLAEELGTIVYRFRPLSGQRIWAESKRAAIDPGVERSHAPISLHRSALQSHCYPSRAEARSNPFVLSVRYVRPGVPTTRLRITSEPPGAEVSLGFETFGGTCQPGNPLCHEMRFIGTTPLTYEYETPEPHSGRYEIILHKPAYQRFAALRQCCRLHAVLQRSR